MKDKSKFESLCGMIDREDVDYTFVNYADCWEIQDKQFHRLRIKYLESRQDLLDYIGFEE